MAVPTLRAEPFFSVAKSVQSTATACESSWSVNAHLLVVAQNDWLGPEPMLSFAKFAVFRSSQGVLVRRAILTIRNQRQRFEATAKPNDAGALTTCSPRLTPRHRQPTSIAQECFPDIPVGAKYGAVALGSDSVDSSPSARRRPRAIS